MKYLHLTLIAALLCGMMACNSKSEPDQPTPPEEGIPSAFPQKHLLEEFTGQDCGYCPYGMDCVHAFMGADTNYVLILHHYGYQEDHFSVAGSQTIQQSLAVSGAPSMSINRATTRHEDGSGVVFHPAYLETIDRSQFADSTYASVVIANTYDAGSRELKVTVSGALCTENHPALSLTVLVKESGMIDYQKDYYNTFEGWQEFRHANAVRAFLSDPKGDAITVDSTRHYEAEYTLTLDSKWDADHCMVVAFLSENFQPVIQANQQPVIAGTKGGADILHGGITRVTVADYYPEPGESKGPADYTQKDTLTLTTAKAYYTQYPAYGITLWTIQAYNKSTSYSINRTACIPFAQIYLFAPYSSTPALPEGSYPFNLTQQAGSVLAGYREDASFTIDGSEFYLISKSYYSQGYLYPLAEWLIADGELKIESDGWSVSGHARNGTPIELVGTKAILNGGKASAPLRRK